MFVEKITKTVYRTMDGEEFQTYEGARSHAVRLELAKFFNYIEMTDAQRQACAIVILNHHVEIFDTIHKVG